MPSLVLAVMALFARIAGAAIVVVDTARTTGYCLASVSR